MGCRKRAIRFCLSVAIAINGNSAFAFTSANNVNLRMQQGPFIVLSALGRLPVIQVEVLGRPTRHFNLGLVLNNYHHYSENEGVIYEANAQSVGIRLDFVFNYDAFTDGFYVSNFILGGRWTTKESVVEKTCTTSFEGTGWALTGAGSLGYQWFWDNGYNINIGPAYIITIPVLTATNLNAPCTPTKKLEKQTWLERQVIWVDLGFGYSF